MAKAVTITTDRKNANKGTQRGEGMLERSLRDYGAGRSVLTDKHGALIAGNKTYSKAQELGIPVQIVETDGRTLVVVRRTDLDLDTDKAAKELGIADNRVSEVSLDWDADTLRALADDGVDLSQFWFDEELDALLANMEPHVALTDPDAVPEPPVEPITKPGDLWLLGEHRLLCGDSTVVTDVDRLMAGSTPTLMVTDPPYGVEYEAEWRNGALKDGAKRRTGIVTNDARVDWREAFSLVPTDVIYCWHDALSANDVQESIEAAGYELRSQLIWAKPAFALSRGHYNWQHEACWYAVRKGANASWIGDHSQTTLWEITLDKNVEGGHSTQKPVECMERPLRNHSGDVYDPFLGSGTTLIAAERQGRRCYGMEISPAYCDVIVKRWEQFTGKTATLAPALQETAAA